MNSDEMHLLMNIPHLTGKQRQLLQLLQTHAHIPSLQRFCRQHGLDFNFVKGFLLGGALDEYVQVNALSQDIWVLTAKGQSCNGVVPGFALAEKLLQGVTTVQQL